jgi:hypothetical protein
MSQIWAERMRPIDAGVSRRSLVAIQQVTEPWTPMNPAGASTMCEPLDKPVLERLMISFAMGAACSSTNSSGYSQRLATSGC